MTSQVTIIKERARESLISKGMLGEPLNYWEAMQLCHNGYSVRIKGNNDWYLKADMIKVGDWHPRYALWIIDSGSTGPREFITESQHLFIEWELHHELRRN